MKKHFLALVALATLPFPALAAGPAENIAGPRLVARIGYETPTVTDGGSIYKIGSAVSYGAEVGLDARIGRVTVGPYASYEGSSVSLCSGTACINVKGMLNIGGRIGLKAGNGVAYIKAGYSEYEIGATSGSFSGSEKENGIAGGIGYEGQFDRSPLFWMIEADYGDFGNFAGVPGVNLQRRHVAAGLGVRF